MARIDTLSNFLTDVADSIRNKTGGQAPIPAEDFDAEIASITTGGGVPLPGEEVTVNALVNIHKGDKVTGVLATNQYPKEFKYAPTQSGTYTSNIPNSDGSVMVNIRSGTSTMYFSFVGTTGYTEQTVSTRFIWL